MQRDYWSAIQFYRSFSTRADAIAEIAKIELGDFRLAFLNRILAEEAFDNMGDNSALVDELKIYPRVIADIQIDKLAEQKRKEAWDVLLTHDQSMVDAGFWEHTIIPGREMTLENCGDNVPKKGWHLFHGGIGAGKTSNVLLPEAAKHKNHDRALVVVPNVKRVYELANQLGWAHYHTYGTQPADIKKAIQNHQQLVICAASLRKITEDPDYFPYRNIYVDELCEIFRYAEHHGSGKKGDEQWWVSLQALFQLSNYADRFLGFTADAPTAFVQTTMEKAAREFHRSAFYYKTNESYAKHQTYWLMNSQEDLIWSVAQKLNDGLSAWGYVDTSNNYGPYLDNFGNILKRLCPDKKIEWFDSKKIKESVMGLPIREMGLVDYIKHKRREGELDCFIASPFARSQYSILFNESEEDLVFDFAFANLKNANIGSPQDGDQGLGRSRQTKQKIVYIAEAAEGTRMANKGDGEKHLIKKYGKEADLTDAEAWEKVWWHCRVQAEQYRLANRASRKWLFKENVELKGATVKLPDIKIPTEELDDYLRIKAEVEAEVVAAQREEPLENDTTRRLKMLGKAYRREGKGWGMIPHDNFDEAELQKALLVDGYTADQIFIILLADEDTRRQADREFLNNYWQITGHLLDQILFDVLDATQLRTQTNFFDWYVNGDESTWFEIPASRFDELKTGIFNNFDNVRKTLNPPLTAGGTVAGFLKLVGDCIGLDFVMSVAKEERTLWRNDLYDQYRKCYRGKFPASLKSWSQRYERIGEIIKPKLTDPNFVPSYAEKRFLDILPDVCRVTKKPIVSREVVNVYSHYLRCVNSGGLKAPRKTSLEAPEILKEALAS